MIKGLVTYLLSKSTVTDLVGTVIKTDTFSQSSMKKQIVVGILIESTGHNRFPHLTGTGGLVNEDFDIHCQSASREATHAIKEAVRLVIDGYTGAMGATSVLESTLTDEHDSYDSPYDGGSTGTFITTLTATIQYRESKPSYSP